VRFLEQEHAHHGVEIGRTGAGQGHAEQRTEGKLE
jgi:hypothetical protein